MRPVFARILLLVATLLAFASWSPAARAQESDPPPALAPRDVGVIVQPAAANLPPPPGDFERIDDGWLTLEFPGSVRDRVAPLAGDADAFRARLAVQLGQPVLDHVLVRVARDPEQMT